MTTKQHECPGVTFESCKPGFLDENKLKTSATELLNIYNDFKVFKNKLWGYHYNVIGPRASMYADLFAELGTLVLPQQILIAKQIRGLGVRVPYMNETVHCSRIDFPKEWISETDMVRDLLKDSERILQNLIEARNKLEKNDPVIADFIEDLSKLFRSLSFRLRSHVSEPGEGQTVLGKEGVREGVKGHEPVHPGKEFAQTEGKKGEPIEVQTGKQSTFAK